MTMQEETGLKSSSKKPPPSYPLCPPLTKLPDTPRELFQALADTIKHSGPGTYAWPWKGWSSSKDARLRLEHFETVMGDRVKWEPFNGSESNDGPMTLNACSGHAFVERVTNGGDAMLELAASTHTGPMPSSPTEAVKLWYGNIMSDDNDETYLTVRMFSSGSKDPKNNVLDMRDYGIGLTGREMLGSILSLNRGNKQHKLYLTGKHGQGASSTYQYADITVIASRKHGTNRVAFTIVEKQWSEGSKTPTYRYLTLDGEIMELDLDEHGIEFDVGTLVRHVGYEGEFYNVFGERSVFGLLQRSLAKPLFPIEMIYHSMWLGSSENKPTGIGAGDRRHIKGTVTTLEEAYEETLNPPKTKRPQQKARIAHRDSHIFRLGEYDFGGRTGKRDAGYVRITYWAARPGVSKSGEEERGPRDVVRNWVVPERPILLTLDGQTHAEEPRAYITSTTSGARLWAVGKLMVVHIDCDGLSRPAKYEMFTSTREALKETPLKWKIMDEVVRLLKLDERLAELNIEFAGGPPPTDTEKDESYAAKLKEYLKASGVSFDKIVRRMVVWRTVEEEQEIKTGGGKGEPPPIKSQEPPTFINWKFKTQPVTMSPGSKYSWLFETDAPSSYWDNEDMAKSRIHVLASGVTFETSGEMKGGRVRCHFRCPESAKPGQRGMIQVQLLHRIGGPPIATSILQVEVTERPAEPKPPGGENKPTPGPGKGSNGPNTKVVKVPVKKSFTEDVEIPVLRPIPITHTDNTWNLLGWPMDPSNVGFSVRSTKGQVQLFYNAEFPAYVEALREMTRRGILEEFKNAYEIKLVLHTIFQLNHGFVDEEDVTAEIRKSMRNLLAASAEDLVHATEMELNLRLKYEKEAV